MSQRNYGLRKVTQYRRSGIYWSAGGAPQINRRQRRKPRRVGERDTHHDRANRGVRKDGSKIR